MNTLFKNMVHRPFITSQKFGNPEIGDKKSAHQARFPSSPIDRSPNSVFSDYRQIRIIRTHQNSSESPNSVIRVTRTTEYEFGDNRPKPLARQKMESLLRESQYFWRKFRQKPQIPNFCEVSLVIGFFQNEASK